MPTKRKLSDATAVVARPRASKRLRASDLSPVQARYSIIDNDLLQQYPAWLAIGCPAEGCRAPLQTKRMQQYGSVICAVHQCGGAMKHETKYYFSKRTKVLGIIDVLQNIC